MDLLLAENVKYIIIHCTDTACDDIFNVEWLRKLHMDAYCDEDIGWHNIILPNGLIELGRPLEYVGNHCIGYNNQSIGIAYVGGRDNFGCVRDTRTPMQKHSLIYWIYTLLRRYPNVREIIGHNDVTTKACPCFDAKKEYGKLITNIKPYLSNY